MVYSAEITPTKSKKFLGITFYAKVGDIVVFGLPSLTIYQRVGGVKWFCGFAWGK